MADVRVPGTNETATASPAGVPNDYMHVDVSPLAFGAGIGAAMQGLGQSVQRAGDTASDIALRQAQVENETAINAGYSYAQTGIQRLSFGDPNDPTSRGYFAMKGRDALDAYPGVVDQLNKVQNDALGMVKAPLARLQLQEQMRRLMNYTLADFGRHRAQQQDAYADQTSESLIAGDHQQAIGFYNDPQKFLGALADSQNTIVQMGQRNGWAPEVIQQRLDDNKSKLFTGVTLRLANENPMRAWNFYLAHQGSITGLDQASLERQLKPQIYGQQSRLDADRIMGGGLGQVAGMVSDEAQRQGVDPGLALTAAKIESGMGSRMQNPNSSAFGVLGLTAGTWAAQGGTATDRGDIGRQVQLGVKNLADSQGIANSALRRPAEPWEAYLVHQQGAAGGPALLTADPGANAVDVLAPAYKGNRAAAQAAIVANGGTPTMSAGQFLDLWRQRYAAAAQGVAAPVSAGAGVPVSTDPRDHAEEWMRQAGNVTNFQGEADPVYQDMVQSRIRARIGEIEYGQAQADRANRQMLLSAAMGVPALFDAHRRRTGRRVAAETDQPGSAARQSAGKIGMDQRHAGDAARRAGPDRAQREGR